MAQRFVNSKSIATAAAIIELAQQHCLHPVTLALACGASSTIMSLDHCRRKFARAVGAQLAAAGCNLSQEILDAVDAIFERFLYPMG